MKNPLFRLPWFCLSWLRFSSLRLGILPFLLMLLILWSVSVGQTEIPFSQLWGALTSWGQGDKGNNTELILWQIRFPRILAAIFVGAALSLSGATYQGMFKNPLVSPDILGVTAGAGLGAVIAIYFGLPLLAIQIVAFISGLVTVFVVYLLSKSVRYQDPLLALVLSGIAIGSLLGAGVALIKIISDPYTQLTNITFWLLGGLNMATFAELKIAIPLILLAIIPLFLLRWRMNLLSLHEDETAALGVNIARTRLIFILSATLMTAVAVSISGIIGWIGLVIPHIARLWVGPNFKSLIVACFFIGAGFLLLTDTIARTCFPIEIPLGIITACIGAPFFLGLLIWGGKR